MVAAASLIGLHVNDIVGWSKSDILRHTATATDGSFDIDLPAGATGRTILKRVGVLGQMELAALPFYAAEYGLACGGVVVCSCD